MTYIKPPKPINYLLNRELTPAGIQFRDSINEIIDYLNNVEDRLHVVENKNGIQHYEPTKLER